MDVPDAHHVVGSASQSNPLTCGTGLVCSETARLHTGIKWRVSLCVHWVSGTEHCNVGSMMADYWMHIDSILAKCWHNIGSVLAPDVAQSHSPGVISPLHSILSSYIK
jgi:hypothetical protein